MNPGADDADLVYANNRTAAADALRAGRAGRPTIEDVLTAGAPWNQFFPPRT